MRLCTSFPVAVARSGAGERRRYKEVAGWMVWLSGDAGEGLARARAR